MVPVHPEDAEHYRVNNLDWLAPESRRSKLSHRHELTAATIYAHVRPLWSPLRGVLFKFEWLSTTTTQEQQGLSRATPLAS